MIDDMKFNKSMLMAVFLVLLSIAGVIIAAFCTTQVWKIVGIAASIAGIIGNAVSFWRVSTWYIE